jgi:hypothetical protein
MRERKGYSIIEGLVRQATNNPIKQTNNVNRHDNVLAHVHNASAAIRNSNNSDVECTGSKQKSPVRDEPKKEKHSKSI